MTVNTNEDVLKLKILLVEDNLINQKLAKKLLEKKNHEVIIANNGLEAVILFEQQHFDLIFMDFQMPIMNGLEATLKIRELEQKTASHIPIIAMTANAMKDDKERAISAGMDAYLPKPINVQELLAQINHFFPSEPASTIHITKEDDCLPVCNWDAALARLGGETEFLEMLVNLFLEEQSSYLENIKRALGEENTSVLERELHTLRGVCATIGGEKIAQFLKKPEALAAQGNFAACRLALPEIEQNIMDLAYSLRKKQV